MTTSTQIQNMMVEEKTVWEFGMWADGVTVNEAVEEWIRVLRDFVGSDPASVIASYMELDGVVFANQPGRVFMSRMDQWGSLKPKLLYQGSVYQHRSSYGMASAVDKIEMTYYIGDDIH